MLRQNQADPPAAARLSSDDLNLVLSDAIRRQSRAQEETERQISQLGQVTSVDDAIEIAQQLNVDEKHVRAALADYQKSRLRGQRRDLVRAGRRNTGIGLLVLGGVVLVGALAAAPALAWVGAAGLLAGGALFLWGMLGGVSDTAADQKEIMPVAGTCRVCGKSAYNERSTFCEEHRYKGPGQ